MQGRYQVKPKFPFMPGAELAGVVRAVGEQVSGIRVGDRVLASGNTGAFAELAVADARAVHVLPDSMSFDEGAALPVIYPTSYAGLVYRGDLRRRRDAARARGRRRRRASPRCRSAARSARA